MAGLRPVPLSHLGTRPEKSSDRRGGTLDAPCLPGRGRYARLSMRPAFPVAKQLLALVLILGLGGCGHGADRCPSGGLWNTRRPGPHADPIRAVYLLRGFGDVFSAGMDTITQDLQQKGVIATVHNDGQWEKIAQKIILDRHPETAYRYNSLKMPRHQGPIEPLVLVGHSWGADDCIRIARELSRYDIRVDLLITVEAVTPPAVPSNVLRAWNIYKPGSLDLLPWWRGVAVQVDRPDQTQLTQIDIPRDWPAVDHWWVGHTDVDNLPAVQDRIVSMVMDACPPPPPDQQTLAREQILEAIAGRETRGGGQTGCSRCTLIRPLRSRPAHRGGVLV